MAGKLPAALRNFRPASARLAAGTALCLLIFTAARLLAPVPGLHLAGTLGLALFLGAGWKLALGVPKAAVPGIRFSAGTLLKLGIVFLGVRLDFGLLLRAGVPLLLADLLVIAVALLTINRLARLLRLPERLGWLLAVGTAVCGASAIAAAAPLTGADDGEVSQAVGIISVLGALAVVAYTVLHPFLIPGGAAYGLFAGATLQEVGHVLAAAAAGGSSAVDAATLAKLTRVALLAPVLLFTVWFRGRRRGSTPETPGQTGPQLPPFLYGFLALGVLASTGLVPDVLLAASESASLVLTGTAMAAIGLNLEPQALRRNGSRAVAAAAGGFGAAAAAAAAALWLAGLL